MDNSIFNWTICCFKYNETGRKPLSLPWGHVYCQEWVVKLSQQTIDVQTVDTGPSLAPEERVIVCPSCKTKHRVNIPSLPLCYAIFQHLPGVKQSVEFQSALLKRIPGPQNNGIGSDDETLRVEFKNVFKVATEELKKSRHWDDVVKQVLLSGLMVFVG